MKRIIVIPRIKIQNANALSSPYTIGFPAMTAWLGAVHAIQRKLNNKSSDFEELKFNSVAVINHEFNLHTYKGTGDFNHSIISTSNPLKKDGKRPSTIEEARCHLTVSLVIEYSEIDQEEAEDMLGLLPSLLHCIKIASGDVLDFSSPYLKKIKGHADTKNLMAQLMPGFCLIDRRDLVQESMQQGLDGLDALLNYLKINSICQKTKGETEEKDNIEWTQSRQQQGWLVPIAIGFQGITDIADDITHSQRDSSSQHRFAESVVSLGEFMMPFRIDNLDNILWHYADLENDLYLCQQNQLFIKPQEQ
ncbi:MAG: type I-F CRISPR-associated protein Csy2 [Methylomarinum sp.]|nr:type I-F CRISPR-associated protein Csy2 [Methylomarinum sp.]